MVELYIEDKCVVRYLIEVEECGYDDDYVCYFVFGMLGVWVGDYWIDGVLEVV